MSTPVLTMWAALAAAAAALLLVALDHRKPARRTTVNPRGRLIHRSAPVVFNVEQEAAVPWRGTPWYRRIGAVFGIGIIGVLMGAIAAIAIGTVLVGAFLLVNNLLG